MSEAIAQQLSGLFHELTEQCSFSNTARTALTRAESSGQVRDLLIWQCDSDELTFTAATRRWWLMDASGLHLGSGKWPVTDAQANSVGWFAEHPMIKFTTDGKRVRFGMRFGRDWYVSREAFVGPDGRFVTASLAEPTPSWLTAFFGKM